MRIGIDIGGTKVDAVVVNGGGTVVAHHRQPVQHGPSGVVRSAVTAAEEVAQLVGMDPRGARSIGVGVPGAVADGVVRHALNLKVEQVDLSGALRGQWGVPIVVENDVNAAAHGAWHLAGGGHTSVAYLNLGTGLAAGVVLNGQLWRGARGAAGEIGHICIDPAGPLDTDGQPGGLETFASGSGITRQWGVPDARVQDVAAAASAGDPRAVDIMERFHYGVATAIRILALTFDVDHVVLGGGLTRMGEPLMRAVGDVVAGWEAGSAFLASLGLMARTTVTDSSQAIAAVGAALLEVDGG